MRQGVIRAALGAAMLMSALGADAQDAQRFINRYKQFVDTAWADKNPTEERMEYNDSVFEQLTNQYHNIYKEEMTAAQIEDYTECRTRYLRQRVSRKAARSADKASDSVDETSDKVRKGAGKVGAKVNGFFRGLFSRK